MGARALHGHVKEVGRSLRGPDAKAADTLVERHFVVRGVDLGDFVLLENPCIKDGEGAAADFFGRLEDADNATGEIALRVQVAKRSHEPRRVPVVTAGVRAPVDRALPGVRCAVRHRKRIAVRAKPDGAPGTVAFHDDNHAALDGRFVHLLEPPAAQRLCDFLASTFGLKAELGMRMDVAAERFEFGLPADDFRKALLLQNDFGHCSLSSMECVGPKKAIPKRYLYRPRAALPKCLIRRRARASFVHVRFACRACGPSLAFPKKRKES